ncbi:M4 family metallopeptidase [Pyxidicoccus parkwayensis]|uniref:Neutral metalloproteinase n=1 Tax=Pyxidicoccus parkwayensis TaxID=2813578 RepID=A0ABX7P7A1_9BACT|nr:M4 family metallopeptidase [Pyxidicoccus parkwaysis]QSQ26326.1 M4 family metallopeptidase [Pyxidicoccus parkwaysis]
MKRGTRWLVACFSLSLAACGSEGPEATQAPREEGVSRNADIEAALRALPGTEVAGIHDDGIPFMLSGPLGETGRVITGASARQANALLTPTLERIAPVFRLHTRDLEPLSTATDAQGHTHLRYAQTKNGLPVVGQQLVLHLDENGRVYAVNGGARDGESVSSEPRIGAQAARQAALTATKGGQAVTGEPQLVYVRAPSTERLTLAFQVGVEGEQDGTAVSDQVFIGALDGAEVWRYSDVHTARNRKVCSVGGPNNGTCRLEGQVATGDAAIDTAYDNLGRFYDCYYANFNQDSYNNAGAQLYARVHYLSNYANAYWDGAGMLCGDGDGTTVGPPCADPDIVVHEFTHAVTDSTSDLVYSGESGALSEAYSDIFAAYCQSWATGPWIMGTDVWNIAELAWTPNTSGDALRYMDDPKRDGASLDYYADYNSSVDVHYGSGIINLAFKLLSTGGLHPRGRSSVNVPGIGIQAAGRIFYQANRNYFTPSTTMAQAKTYTRSAAQALGYGTAILDAVDKAWLAVGVGATTPPPTCTLLTNGVTLTGLSGTAGSQQYYCLDVPANLASAFTMSSGTGDADMYVKFGSAPTTSSYDCRPYVAGNNETCNLAARTTAGRYWVMLRGYSAYSGVSLKGQY